MAAVCSNAATDGAGAEAPDAEVLRDDVITQPTSGIDNRQLIDVGCLDNPTASVTTTSKTADGTDCLDFGLSVSCSAGSSVPPSNEAVDLCPTTQATGEPNLPPPTSEPQPLVSLVPPSTVIDGQSDGGYNVVVVNDDVNKLLEQATPSGSFESSQSTATSHDSVETVQSFRHQPQKPADADLVQSDFAAAETRTELANGKPTSEVVAHVDVGDATVVFDADKSGLTAAEEPGSHVTSQSDTVDCVNQPALPEEQAVEPRPPSPPPPPTAEFKTGITCCDAPTALDILNTRYLLSDVTIHKNMITWSSWNIADMVRGPHRDSFWWKGKRRGRYVQQSATEADQPTDAVDNKSRSDQPDGTTAPAAAPAQNGPEEVAVKDIEVLRAKIDQKEQEIELMLQRNELRQQQQLAAAAGINEEAVTAAAAQKLRAEPGTHHPEQQKRENVFQRFLRAIRQRFSRHPQHGGETGSAAGQKHETSSLQDHRSSSAHRRQRTL